MHTVLSCPISKEQEDDMEAMGTIVITCPTSNEPVNTGIRITEEAFRRGDFMGEEYRCTRCSQTHTWDASNARLEGSA